MIPKIKYEYLLLLFGIFWALFFSHVIQLKAGFSVTGDDGTYLLAARKLYLEHQFDDSRPLLISVIDGFPFLFGFSDTAVINWGIALNFCCWFFTALLVFRIISGRLDRQRGFWFAIAFILCIGNLANAFNFLSETIFIFMTVASLHSLNRYYETAGFKFLSLSIAILLLAVLVKPVAIGLAVILGVLHITRWRRILWNQFSFFILIGVSLIFFQMYSMKKASGDYTISYVDAITYYNYLGAKADCYRKDTVYFPGENARAEYFTKFTSHEQKKIAFEDLKEQLRNNTLNLAKAYLFCIYSNSSKGNYIVSDCSNEKQTHYFNVFYFLFKAISKAQNIIFTILGVSLSFICLLKRKKYTLFELTVSAFLLYIFFISATSCFQCDRFHSVFFPWVIILSTKWVHRRQAE